MGKYVVYDLEMCKVPKGEKREEFGSHQELIQIGAVMVQVTTLELAASTTPNWKNLEIFPVIVDYFTLSSAICRFYGLFK